MMDHSQAVTTGATERYLLGELSERERDDFEEHYFGCPVCAADVRAAATVVEGAPAVLGDGEGEPRVFADASEPAGVLAPARVERPRRPWGAVVQGWFYPMPWGAAAALLLAAVGLTWQGFVALPAARRDLAVASAPQPASWAFLSISRSTQQVVTVSRADRWLGLTLSRATGDDHPAYRCRLSRDGVGVFAWSVPAAEPGGELQTAVPLEGLTAASYTLAIDGLAGPGGAVQAADLARYEFSLRYRGE